MTEERFVQNGDITLRVEVTGEGPTILCVHGWPELAYSWRHQVDHFASRGHRVAAMDVRGYGGSSVPVDVERYTLRELAGDVAAVARALDDEPVVLVGHDWGAPIVWNTAIRHPDRVRAVAGLSVPHSPQLPISLVDIFDQLYADRFFYMLYFQEPGVAEHDFGVDLRAALQRVYFALSGEAPPGSFSPDAPRGASLLPELPDPPAGPLGFLDQDDLDVYVRAFERTGMVGAFNRYRATGLDVEASADIVGATVDQPSCFIGGELDMVRTMIPGVDSFADPGSGCTDFRGSTIVAGAGHWVQQEAPAEVNAALEAFLASV
ncbi:MAG: alpha/beta hydrolase [Acidimicrobiales bacterium]